MLMTANRPIYSSVTKWSFAGFSARHRRSPKITKKKLRYLMGLLGGGHLSADSSESAQFWNGCLWSRSWGDLFWKRKFCFIDGNSTASIVSSGIFRVFIRRIGTIWFDVGGLESVLRSWIKAKGFSFYHEGPLDMVNQTQTQNGSWICQWMGRGSAESNF